MCVCVCFILGFFAIWKRLCVRLEEIQEWLKLEKLSSIPWARLRDEADCFRVQEGGQPRKAVRAGPSAWNHSQEGKSPGNEPAPGPSGPGRSPGSLPTWSQQQTRRSMPRALQEARQLLEYPQWYRTQFRNLTPLGARDRYILPQFRSESRRIFSVIPFILSEFYSLFIWYSFPHKCDLKHLNILVLGDISFLGKWVPSASKQQQQLRISYKAELRALASPPSFLSQTCKKKVTKRWGKEAVSDVRPVMWYKTVMQAGEGLWHSARLWGCVGVSPGEACLKEGIEEPQWWKQKVLGWGVDRSTE